MTPEGYRGAEEFAWRHFWLRNVMLDSGRPSLARMSRPRVTRRMSLARRLDKLHRLRAALEPPRSWIDAR
jgi:hypothetical protein